jgi:hypothetical protein
MKEEIAGAGDPREIVPNTESEESTDSFDEASVEEQARELIREQCMEDKLH